LSKNWVICSKNATFVMPIKNDGKIGLKLYENKRIEKEAQKSGML